MGTQAIKLERFWFLWLLAGLRALFVRANLSLFSGD